MTDAARCRKNGWRAGDLLIRRERIANYQLKVKLTHVGEELVLGKVARIGDSGFACESLISLYDNEWDVCVTGHS